MLYSVIGKEQKQQDLPLLGKRTLPESLQHIDTDHAGRVAGK